MLKYCKFILLLFCFQIVGAFISFECLILAAIVVSSPPNIQWVAVNNKLNEWTFECSNSESSKILWWILFIYHTGILIWTSKIAFQSRKVVDEFSNTQSILASVMIISFSTAIVTPIGFILHDPMSVMLISSIAQGVVTILVLSINFFPKLAKLVRGGARVSGDTTANNFNVNFNSEFDLRFHYGISARLYSKKMVNEALTTNKESGKLWVVYPEFDITDLAKQPVDEIRQEYHSIKKHMERLELAMSNAVIQDHSQSLVKSEASGIPKAKNTKAVQQECKKVDELNKADEVYCKGTEIQGGNGGNKHECESPSFVPLSRAGSNVSVSKDTRERKPTQSTVPLSFMPSKTGKKPRKLDPIPGRSPKVVQNLRKIRGVSSSK